MITSAESPCGNERLSPSAAARLRRIEQLPLEYIDSAEFHRQNARHAILGPLPDGNRARECIRPPKGLMPYLADLYRVPLLTPQQERHLFRKYNYLKYRAATLREERDSNWPDSRLMDEIENLYLQAEQVRNQIIEANLRLVVSLAKPRASDAGELQDLISDGNMTLIRAVEKFDYTLGNKFSTYATWAIRRTFARSIPMAVTQRKRFCNGMDEKLATAPDRDDSPVDEPSLAEEWCDKLQQLLDELPQRERHIIVHRFGLLPGGQKETLQALGDEIGVSKERVRQLEYRAIDKLRAAAETN